jgi:hypothetical protein
MDERRLLVKLLLKLGHACDKANVPAVLLGVSPPSSGIVVDRAHDWQMQIGLVQRWVRHAQMPIQRDRKVLRSGQMDRRTH